MGWGSSFSRGNAPKSVGGDSQILERGKRAGEAGLKRVMYQIIQQGEGNRSRDFMKAISQDMCKSQHDAFN